MCEIPVDTHRCDIGISQHVSGLYLQFFTPRSHESRSFLPPQEANSRFITLGL